MRYRKIKWKEVPENLEKISTAKLEAIIDHNISYIDMVCQNAQSSYREERLYNELNPISEELNRRKSAISGEETMATNNNVSPRIKTLADNAHELMNRKRNPLSVRKACDAAGLSIASYYKVYPSNSQSEGTVVSAAVKREVAPARKKRRATSGITANPSRIQNRIDKNKDTIEKMKNYISKLEHKLVKLTLSDDEE